MNDLEKAISEMLGRPVRVRSINGANLAPAQNQSIDDVLAALLGQAESPAPKRAIVTKEQFIKLMKEAMVDGSADARKMGVTVGPMTVGEAEPLSSVLAYSVGLPPLDLETLATLVKEINLAEGATDKVEPVAETAATDAKTDGSAATFNSPLETSDNGVALHAHGLKIIHFHSEQTVKGTGMTVCYCDPSEGGIRNPRTVEIAVSVVHPEDTFSKKKGTETAIRHFLEGHTVKLPVIPGLSVIETLKSYFWVHDSNYTNQVMGTITY